ncbi:MAG: ATP-dependent helicase [Gemmatimonadaceae bacterium]
MSISQHGTTAAPAGPPRAEPLDGLNPAQREAVLHFEGPLLVIAGAGSGKTRVLTTRIARLIEHHGVDPRQILAVTFTNKAAGEMRERIARILGHEPAGMWVGTFHAIGARMLRSAAHLVGRTPNFTIYDEDDALAVVKRLMEKHKLSPKERPPKAIHASISDAKNALVSPGEYEALAMDPHAKAVALVYKDLEPTLRQANAVTFDDLLVLPVQVLREHPPVLESYRQRFRFVLVDEYQDTNVAQYQLVKLLGGAHGNVLVVGDDDQSIYGWRGADIRNILHFEKDFPSARVVRLEENYRSTPEILDLANVAISANAERRGKTLRATRPSGERVTAVATLDERDEADFVAEEIQTRRSSSSRLLLRDFAILYRTNSQSRALEEAMRRRALPYRLVGAVRFYDRREIRDLMAYLKLIANPADNEAFRRAVAVPKRGLGETTVEALAERADAAGVPLLAAAARPELVAGLRPAARAALADFSALVHRLRERARDAAVDELLRELIDAIKYGDYLRAEGPESAERLDNVRELINGAGEQVADEGGEVGLTPLDHFLQKATLVAGIDGLDPNADAVTMMTMHNAKGLEFPVVFVTGLEEGLFPLSRAIYDGDPKLLEEERRLFYVGITRAERKLFLTHAESRRRNGETLPSQPSSFLRELPREMLEHRKTIKVRSQGRVAYGDASSFGGGSGFGGGARTGASAGGWGKSSSDWSGGGARPGAAERRPGTPVSRGGFAGGAAADPAEESQDAALYAVGARVKHRMFGSGTIAELSGSGPSAKVRVDFDDESVGRKTLVVAQARLERGDD